MEFAISDSGQLHDCGPGQNTEGRFYKQALAVLIVRGKKKNIKINSVRVFLPLISYSSLHKLMASKVKILSLLF